MSKKVRFIDQTEIRDKTVLLRVDYNVSLTLDYEIADNQRIQQSLPTINHLLERNNKLVIISHLGRPKGRDPKFSLKKVARNLNKFFPKRKVSVVNHENFRQHKNGEILLLENIRFHPGEKNNDPLFAKQLSRLGDVYVNDAFGVSHRINTSIVSLPALLPAYGGLLLKKEMDMIKKAIDNPKKPLVAIIGGAKVSTKINFIKELTRLADYILVGGGLANTFLRAKGLALGQSYFEPDEIDNARRILIRCAKTNTIVILPEDVVLGIPNNQKRPGKVEKVESIKTKDFALDIGPETQARFGAVISRANTIIWNGPMGYIENPLFRRGTDFIYYTIAQNTLATSIVGGGDTLSAISKKEYLDKITHLSTGGGAMLEYIEKGTTAGIEALKK